MLKLHKIGPNSYKQLIFTMHGLDPSFKCKLLEYKDFQMVTQISVTKSSEIFAHQMKYTKVGRREAAASRLGLNKRKKKKEKLDIEEVLF